MNAVQKRRNEALNAIGRELDDLSLSGRLDFERFKSLFTRALDAAGSDTDDLEMFCQEARDPEWWNWMMQELQNAPTRRVASPYRHVGPDGIRRSIGNRPAGTALVSPDPSHR